LHLTRFDLTTPQREDLEQRQGLLRLLETSDILTTALASPFWVMTKGSPCAASVRTISAESGPATRTGQPPGRYRTLGRNDSGEK